MESCCEQGNSQSGGTKLNHKQQRKLVCGFEVCLCSLCFIEIVQYTINLSKSNQSLQGFLHSHFNMLVLELLAWWLSVTNNNSSIEEYTKWTINCLPQIMYLILVVGGGGYCGFQVTGMIKIWEQEKQKPKTILRASNKTPIKPGPLIFTPKIAMLTVIPKPQFGFTFLPNYGAEKGTTTNLLQKNRYLN